MDIGDKKYMSEPADAWQDKTFTLEDGNTMGYAQYGKPDGFTLIYFHGLPSSRGEGRLWQDAAAKLRVQIVAVDRPGMGLSTRIQKRQINDYAAQVAQLVAHLELGTYSILGVSGGGPYALACAAHKELFPGLHKVGVCAGLGSRELPNTGMSFIQRMSIGAMDWVPGGLFCWFWNAAIGKAARNPDPKVLADQIQASVKMLKGDDAKYSDELVVEAMTAALRGAFAQGSQGYLDEATIVCRPWGFKLSDIKEIDVSFWYGGKDGLAPPAAGKALADSIPGSHFISYEGETHTVVTLKHREEILSYLSS